MAPSKRPKSVNKPLWGEAEKQLVLRIRREDTTYGKGKSPLLSTEIMITESVPVLWGVF